MDRCPAHHHRLDPPIVAIPHQELERERTYAEKEMLQKKGLLDILDDLEDEDLSDRVIIAKLMQVIEEYEQELYQFLPNTAYQAIKDWKDLLGASSPIP